MIQQLTKLTIIPLFALGVAFSVAAALDGNLLALLMTPVLWIAAALDPDIGRWRHLYDC